MPDLRVWFYLLLRDYLDSLRLLGLGFLAFYLTYCAFNWIRTSIYSLGESYSIPLNYEGILLPIFTVF